MAIKRYTATKDTTIYNAFKPGLLYRATGSNAGLADSLEVFHIYGQQSSASSENARALVQFPVSSISTDRTAGTIPASGSVSYYLRMFNVAHPFSTPREVTYAVCALTKSWDEGWGTDIDEYSNYGEANWEVASTSSGTKVEWDTQGGDFFTGAYIAGSTLPNYTATFSNGTEDLEIDITSLVEEWIAGTETNNGIIIKLTSSIETSTSSSYTKRFSARGSEYFFKRPIIEARWDDSKKDQRAMFLCSSSMAPADDNNNTIYYYNYIRGRLTNIPAVGTGNIYVVVYDDPTSGSVLTTPPITGGFVETGIYSATFALNTTASYVYDRWYNINLAENYYTGSIKVIQQVGYSENPNPKYVFSIPNLKDSYDSDETEKIKIYTREKNWCPNIYTKATQESPMNIIEDVYYRVKRVPDNLIVIDYGTGSLNHTRLSYDVSGSYFDLDMEIFQSGYMYEISFIFADSSIYREAKEKFRFRVE